MIQLSKFLYIQNGRLHCIFVFLGGPYDKFTPLNNSEKVFILVARNFFPPIAACPSHQSSQSEELSQAGKK